MPVFMKQGMATLLYSTFFAHTQAFLQTIGNFVVVYRLRINDLFGILKYCVLYGHPSRPKNERSFIMSFYEFVFYA